MALNADVLELVYTYAIQHSPNAQTIIKPAYLSGTLIVEYE